MPGNPQIMVTMAASEAVPFAKTGGLADMVGALSSSLAAAGVRVNLVIPAYRNVLNNGIDNQKPYQFLDLKIENWKVSGSLIRNRLSTNLDVFFVRGDDYFDRECLYGDSAGDYQDNAERFAYFSRAVLEVARMTKSQVIHLHDWQAATAAAFLRLQPKRYTELAAAKTVVTIHNLAYQGLFNFDRWPALNLDPCYFNSCQFEFWSQINYLKSGLVNADRLTTVSPTYACEIRQDGCGFGLEGVLQERANNLSGILNGVDYSIWNPETDVHISRKYSAADLSGKAECKRFLQESYGLDSALNVPLLCMITRLVEGKGIELVMEIVGNLISRGVQLVMLGRGDLKYADFFSSLAVRYPGQVGLKIAFDEALAHQTIAGADILLMPSRQEPCGLTQMYALKYGTVPIVRRTGGLADSVELYDQITASGDGFLFDDYSGEALLDKIKQALTVYDDKTEWQNLVRRGMAADHSWNHSTREYLRLYRELVPN